MPSDEAAPPASDLQRELELAREAALSAGEILERYFRDRGFEIEQKGKDNPVTTADFDADSEIKSVLRGPFPEYGWLSEETADSADRLSRRRVWIVDPLDGTKEFIKGIPEFVIAIALAEEGSPILGVTYNPIKREMFWCARGGGCYMDGRPVHVTATPTLEHATVLASRSETSRGEWKNYEGKLRVNPIGSVAYKLALVAAGHADATFTRTAKSEWDIASGAALIVEAGGRITDIDGSEMRFNKPSVKLKGFVASNAVLHDEIERLVPHPDRPKSSS
ncbi:MAG: 3'(2'),5'-bisphosphate nucleotidase CysQ [Deltaproteobacteria bacterium]|nr:3'(2'),5'-bisphosphate nucleotidase CysQ [Deltaproteobacteria bacterium]